MSEARKRDGGVVCYETFGSERQPPLVLIEGLSAHLLGWRDELCELLAESFWVVRFDNRDVGLSTHYPGADYAIEDLADDVVELLDHLGATSAHVVGQSMGGMVAQLLALRHPDRVASLTLVYTTASIEHIKIEGRPGPSDGAVPPATREEAIEAYVAQEREGASTAYEFDEAWKRTLGGLMWDRGLDPEGVERQTRAVLAHHVDLADLSRIEVPTLVMHGTADPLIDHRASVELHEAIPRKRAVAGRRARARGGTRHLARARAADPQELRQRLGDPMSQVRTESGVVSGGEEQGCLVFRGVPYAAPPFGPHRFRPPQPVIPWDGVRDATQVGPQAPQPDTDDELETAYFNVPTRGEDCLTVQVWTPDTSGSLPVMVWIHGGAFLIGAAGAPAYSGHTFAQSGIVHVAISYRLGVEGFIYLGEGTDNLGLRDQVAALEWVRRNIGAFGGDPDEVTICGQSAGGLSVFDLLAMPSAKGLFKRAIAQSGTPMGTVSIAEATKVTRRLARKLGTSPTAEGFRATSVEAAVEQALPLAFSFANPLRSGSSAFNLSPFRAVHGTPSLPRAPMDAAVDLTGVPLLTGTVQNETTEFLELLGSVDDINPVLALAMRRFMKANRTVVAAYRDGPRRIRGRLALIEAAWTDWALRIPTLRLAEVRADPTYVYEFRWNGTQFARGLSSTHTLEVPFTRNDVQSLVGLGPIGTKVIGTDPPELLAKEMHEAWVQFVCTGDPGWARYDTTERATHGLRRPQRSRAGCRGRRADRVDRQALISRGTCPRGR